ILRLPWFVSIGASPMAKGWRSLGSWRAIEVLHKACRVRLVVQPGTAVHLEQATLIARAPHCELPQIQGIRLPGSQRARHIARRCRFVVGPRPRARVATSAEWAAGLRSRRR